MATASVDLKPMTADEFAEFVRLPENENRWFELVGGGVLELPPPMKIHGVVCVNTGTQLHLFVRRRKKGYVTSNDSGVILSRDPDTVRGPDVALYEDAQRWSELHPKYGEVPPRLAVEVFSPNDKLGKLLRKIAEYLRAGVEIVWLIDPDSRNVTVFRPGLQPVVVEEDGELIGYDVLPDLNVKVAELFWMPEANGS